MQVNQWESEASLGYKNETLSQKHQCTRLLDMHSNNKTLSPIAYHTCAFILVSNSSWFLA